MARAAKRKPRMDNLTKGLLVAFAVVGILLAYVGGKFVYNLVTGWSLTSLPGAPIAPTTDPNATAVATQSFQTNDQNATPWDGKSRVNILLLGLDYSAARAEKGENQKLTDTMILVTIDPISQTIGAMSIRRDLWVLIPEGYGYDKINTAYSKGLNSDLPGVTGPGLVMETVENFLGIDINYYAIINLDTFVKIIDEIDGVKIEVKAPMLLDWNGSGEKFWIQPGIYTMPGQYALAYARCRTEPAANVDCGDELGDIGRGARQMQVIQAVRDRFFEFKLLPKLISRAPALYQDVSEDVQTNMSLNEAIQLMTLMVKIPQENMTTYNIDYTMVEDRDMVFNGAFYKILVPYPDKIRVVRDQMFSTGSATAPLTLGTDDALILALQENARIQILNGTMTGNLADTTSEFLKAKGLNVVGTGNTDAMTYSRIVITGTIPYPYTYAYLKSLLPGSEIQIVYHVDSATEADLIFYLGDDWAGSNAMTQ